jgi:hypothetical protein
MAAEAGKRSFLPRHVPPMMRSTRARLPRLAATAARLPDLLADTAPCLALGQHLATILALSVL